MTVVDYDRASLRWLTLEDQSGNRRTYSGRTPIAQPVRPDIVCGEGGLEVQPAFTTLPDEIIVDIPENVSTAYGMASSAHVGSYKYIAQ